MPLLAVRVRSTLAPSLSSRFLLTSAIFTSSITCCGAVTRSRLTILLRVAVGEARLMTWSSLTASLTLPVSTRCVIGAPDLDAASPRASVRQLGLQRSGSTVTMMSLTTQRPSVLCSTTFMEPVLLAQEEQFGRAEQRDLGVGDAVGCLRSRRRRRRAAAAAPAPVPASRRLARLAGWPAATTMRATGKSQADHPDLPSVR